MSKIDKSLEIIDADLQDCFEVIDIEVGRIKRRARQDGSLVSGETIYEVVEVLLNSSNRLENAILKVHEEYRNKLWWGESKFDKKFSENASCIFNELKEYVLVVLEESAKLTDQKHLYGQHYPGLQKHLDSTIKNISNFA